MAFKQFNLDFLACPSLAWLGLVWIQTGTDIHGHLQNMNEY